jgi:hypothetical protein
VETLSGRRLFRLEGLWFWHNIRSRHRRRDYERTEGAYLRREIARRIVRTG